MLDLTRGNADTMPTNRPERVVATGVGPRATLVRTNLQAMYPHVKKAWVEEAQLTAILGNRASTLKSLRSGVCCYITFIGEHLREAWFCVRSAYLAYFYFISDACGNKGGPYFPPKLDMLLAWSQLFRSKDTFGNYLNHVRTACLLVKQPVEVSAVLQRAASDPYRIEFQVFSNPALKKAKQSILSVGQFSKRERLFVQRQASCAQLLQAVVYFSFVFVQAAD